MRGTDGRAADRGRRWRRGTDGASEQDVWPDPRTLATVSREDFRVHSAFLRSLLDRPLLRPRLPPELLLNRLDDEVHEHDVVRHAVQLEATVKLLRDAGRQLRLGFFGLRHHAALVFDPARRPRPRRRLRRRRTVFAFGPGVGAAPFFPAIFAATAFGGRPGPPGRQVPRVLRRRRRRPFVALVLVEMPPSRDWIAERSSCCTMSRITVTRLRCLGMSPRY
jgi:hypothetical protein